MSIPRGHDDIASRGVYAGHLANKGMSLDAEDWLDWLLADSRCGPAKFSQLIYPERSRRLASVIPDRRIAREGVLWSVCASLLLPVV